NSQFFGRDIARLAPLLLGAHLAGATPSVPPFAHDSAATVAPETKSVRVTTRREGEATQFFVENNEFCEITMTFEMGLVNLKGANGFPYTATFPPRKVT